jgi:hypothetical protein
LLSYQRRKRHFVDYPTTEHNDYQSTFQRHLASVIPALGDCDMYLRNRADAFLRGKLEFISGSRNVPSLLKQNPVKSIILMDGYDLRMTLCGMVDLRDFILTKAAKLSFESELFMVRLST